VTSVARQAFGLLGWLAVTFAAAALGAMASVDASDFYAQLARPAWAPPASWFGPVWTVLYVLMAVAAWLVWRRAGWARARGALLLYLAQLPVNALWSWLFFAWREGALAMADVVVLWALIAATTVAFWRHHRVAGAMLLPYLAWVSFATALTYAIWQLNPTLL
jgi:benzodiazapine receptor